jgi:cytochrome bd-type quinol oxidase subunit 2
MENFQYSTEEELYLMKKKLVENDKLRTQANIFTYVTLGCLILLMVCSMYTIRDEWVCELDQENKNQSHICKELRSAVNCKTTIAPPIRAEVLLRINNTIRASAYAFCGWDTAVSEIRLCFIMLSFISVYFSFKALSRSSKKLAEISSYSAFIFAFLLLISSLFDYIQILDSRVNNYNLCNLRDEFKVESNVDVILKFIM